jgi:uncharacterized cupredoxin-like copper-binding protein
MHRSLSAARLAGAAVVVLAVLAVAGGALAAPSHKTSTVKVTATEFHFALSPATAKAGAVKFTIVNKGKLAHDFSIAGKTSAMIQPGKTATLTVVLKKGKYPYRCTVPGHAAAGMKGILTVT